MPTEGEAPEEAPRRGGVRHGFNEAAHKLGYWPVKPTPRETPKEPSDAIKAARDDDRDVVAHAGRLVLGLGALGVVFGDIGTSPLYTMQVIFGQHKQAAHTNIDGVYGVVSLMFWALVIVVSIKYAIVIMRAHNRGDGGVMALAALISRKRVPRAAVLITLGLVGAGLFLGDGMITPAISVTSAVEGLKVATPGLSHSLIDPIALVILVALFTVQRFGTGGIGWLFGPVMLLWFASIGVIGAGRAVAHPAVFQALSPIWGARFMLDHGVAAWLTLGGVVLAITGAEALYADRGHFGKTPIRMTWFSIVFPAVLLNYLGQGAFILDHPGSPAKQSFNPFYMVSPGWAQLPLVFLATAATIIASQAALTGSFSVAKQAVQLGFMPRLRIRHTSELEGQIYVPIINWLLCAGVVALVLVFRNSNNLSDIYGVAVTGTFILDTTLFVAVAYSLWRTPRWRLFPMAAVFYIVELSFFSANVTKVEHGAWLPLLVGVLVASVMVTWRKGREMLTRSRTEEEGSLQQFLEGLCDADPPIVRLPGTAIFLNPSKETTPLAMRAQVEHLGAFQETVVMVSLDPIPIPHVERDDRFSAEKLGRGMFKITYVTIRVGYRDRTNLPELLALARKQGMLPRNFDLEHASYFVSRMSIAQSDAPGMHRWRKRLFIAMARNSSSPIEHFGLPWERTVSSGSQVAL
ncbi:MAG TPA: KUP/HAK/KT family potassium transporter [Solirubrobacteraceae bacterium]|nr:KUP/HAK/KT family potassium transporter [Solirubrobacteraceae bacterium]